MKRSTVGCAFSFALLLACCALEASGFAQNGTPAGGGPATPTAVPGAGTTNPTLSLGMAELQANRARQALIDFQEVLKTNPGDAAANLLASTAAVELFQGQLAVQYAEKARQLDPRNWKIHTTLVAAYSSAGMKQQRDQERTLLQELPRTGGADARVATGFLVEMFPLGNYRVDAIEYFEPMGKFHTYYRFLVRRQDGHRVWEVGVQSDDFDQKSWAAAHATDATAGEMRFQL